MKLANRAKKVALSKSSAKVVPQNVAAKVEMIKKEKNFCLFHFGCAFLLGGEKSTAFTARVQARGKRGAVGVKISELFVKFETGERVDARW